jgi:CDGSH-type Zn-finger protein
MPTRITINNNASLQIEGDDFEIIDANGQKFDLAGRSVVKLCRCGQSANKPFCDGSHARCGFDSQVIAYTLPPPKPKI